MWCELFRQRWNSMKELTNKQIVDTNRAPCAFGEAGASGHPLAFTANVCLFAKCSLYLDVSSSTHLCDDVVPPV